MAHLPFLFRPDFFPLVYTLVSIRIPECTPACARVYVGVYVCAWTPLVGVSGIKSGVCVCVCVDAFSRRVPYTGGVWVGV